MKFIYLSVLLVDLIGDGELLFLNFIGGGNEVVGLFVIGRGGFDV